MMRLRGWVTVFILMGTLGLCADIDERQKAEVLARMVFVEGGEFDMGSNTGVENERPVHRVRLDSFYISRYELTVSEYVRFLNETGTKYPWVFNDESGIEGEAGNCHAVAGRENHAAVFISWNDVQRYIKWLNKKTGLEFRLPSEAEWEYAARGGKKSKGHFFSGGDDPGLIGWFKDNSGGIIHAVGQKTQNELGIHDMSGNVWEWCQDWYGHEYYSHSPSINPQGPKEGTRKVLRGGSWDHPADSLRCGLRCLDPPDFSYNNIGARLALTSKR